MNKPKKPSKKIEIEKHATFLFDYSSKKVSLQYFINWINGMVPSGSYDVAIGLEEEPEYCYCEGSCDHGFTTYLAIYWKQKVINRQYDKEMARYQKRLAKWKKSVI